MSPATKREREGGMMHLNHSCEPNLGLQGQVVYVSLRDIEADEELTFDYAMNDDEPDEMPVWNTKLPWDDHRPRLAQARDPEQV